MLGSTHGTLTTDFRARVEACGETPRTAVHSSAAPSADDAVPVDVSGRPLQADVPDLDRFFRPESVAVVGASDADGRPNAGITRRLIAWAERVGARIHPVHPTRPTVFGRTCYASVADLPEQVDLAVLLVADPLPVIEELAETKVRFAVAFASGFAETGDEGAAAQERLAAAVRRSGLRLLGPNTNLNAFEEFREDLDGPAIALITQSGHQAVRSTPSRSWASASPTGRPPATRPIWRPPTSSPTSPNGPRSVPSPATWKASRTAGPSCWPPTGPPATASPSSPSRWAAPRPARAWPPPTPAS